MITELTYFLGGVLMSGLIGLVSWVSSNRKMINEIKQEDDELLELIRTVQDEVKDIHDKVRQEINDVYRNMDAETKRTVDIIESITSEQNHMREEMNRNLDSRLDKFENRLTKINNDGCEPVKNFITDVKKQLNG